MRFASGTKLTGPERPEYFLVDPASKRARKIEGDFRPIPYDSRHAFQPAGPDQIWAVTSKEETRASVIGRYDLRRFAFTPVMELAWPAHHHRRHLGR